jgi:hypothetical protein
VFERFTDRARRVVVLAQENSRLLHHNYIGTEHVLLGLLAERDGIAARALTRLGVDMDAARRYVEAHAAAPSETPASGHIPFTPNAKRALEGALREALQLGHNYIGTEHLLLGLLRQGDTIGAQALVALGAPSARVRSEVVQLLAGHVGTTERVPSLIAGQRHVVIQRGVQITGHCAFCARPIADVDRAVTSGSGVALCIDCARLAVERMEALAGSDGRVAALAPPPHVAGEAPDEQSVNEIIELFATWPRSGVDTLPRVVGGETLRDVAEAIAARHGSPDDVMFIVERLNFVTTEVALVGFRISREPHIEMDGVAVRKDGEWKIARETYCAVARLAGVPCPPET